MLEHQAGSETSFFNVAQNFFNTYVKIYFKHVCIFSFVFNLFPQIKNWGMFSLSRFV